MTAVSMHFEVRRSIRVHERTMTVPTAAMQQVIPTFSEIPKNPPSPRKDFFISFDFLSFFSSFFSFLLLSFPFLLLSFFSSSSFRGDSLCIDYELN